MIVGIAGGVGYYTASFLHDTGYTDFVGVDTNLEVAAAKLAADWQVPLYGTISQAMAAEDIGGIYICTPDAVHVESCVEALKFGIPVLCEKPMGINREQAVTILEADRASAGWLQIGFEYRFSKA